MEQDILPGEKAHISTQATKWDHWSHWPTRMAEHKLSRSPSGEVGQWPSDYPCNLGATTPTTSAEVVLQARYSPDWAHICANQVWKGVSKKIIGGYKTKRNQKTTVSQERNTGKGRDWKSKKHVFLTCVWADCLKLTIKYGYSFFTELASEVLVITNKPALRR